MDSKALHLILLTASIFAVATCTFTHGSASGSAEYKVGRTGWKVKGSDDNGNYRLNTGYPVAYAIEEHHTGDGYDGNYKGKSIIDQYDKFGPSVGQGKHQGSYQASPGNSGYNHKNDQGVKDSSDNYNHGYKHGYHRSYGHSHHHDSNDKGKDGIGDSYQGYHRVRFEHDHDGGKDSRGGCAHSGCNSDGYHYDDGFEFHYGDDGKEQKERSRNGDGRHGGYGADYGRDIEHSSDRGRNEGVDVHGADYHRGYTEGGGNYGKDYPSSASDHHYRRHERDYDPSDHRHGLDRRNR